MGWTAVRLMGHVSTVSTSGGSLFQWELLELSASGWGIMSKPSEECRRRPHRQVPAKRLSLVLSLSRTKYDCGAVGRAFNYGSWPSTTLLPFLTFWCQMDLLNWRIRVPEGSFHRNLWFSLNQGLQLRRTWRYQEISGDIWRYLEISGDIWRCWENLKAGAWSAEFPRLHHVSRSLQNGCHPQHVQR